MILMALAKMRFMTTRQLAWLFFGGSRSAANKRLRKLLDAHMIKVWPRSLAEDNLYSITRIGARNLPRREDGYYPVLSPPRIIEGNLDHLLAINEVRVSLAASLREVGGALSWWKSEWDLRALGSSRVIPDALFGIRWDRGEERSYALEIDNETRSTGGFLKKMLRYEAVQLSQGGLLGILDFTILLVGKEPRWVERYRRSLDGDTSGVMVWFATLDELRREGAGGSIWTSNTGEKKYSLREIGSFPFSKEGEAEKTCMISS